MFAKIIRIQNVTGMYIERFYCLTATDENTQIH
jgi:hypothetical protein